MNLYNIAYQRDYNISEINSEQLKQSNQNIYYSPYTIDLPDINLPGTNTLLLFANDRILSNSYIISSDDSKSPKINDIIDVIKLSSIVPLSNNIHKPTPKRIKN